MGVVLASVLFGLIGGSVLPRPAYRLAVALDEPHRDSCVDCGRSLPSGIRTRCPGCGRRLGPPVWLTAGLAAVACGLIAVALGPVPVLVPFLGLAVLGVLLGVVDVACKRLPHVLVLPGIAVSAVLFVAIAAGTGDWAALGRAGAAAVGLTVAFGLLYLLPGRGVGLGDVTLAALLGGYLGWLGWRFVLLGAVLPWLVNVPVLVVLLVSGRIGRKATVPFGPAMLVGALLAVVAGRWLDVFARP
jgi:leader peptidase (prepilin peptidase)/N-methyltransferase